MIIRTIIAAFLAAACLLPGIVYAVSDGQASPFESVMHIVPAVRIPTVVEVPVSGEAFRIGDYAVLEDRTGSFQSGLYREGDAVAAASIRVDAEGAADAGAIADGSVATWAEFPVVADTEEAAVALHFRADRTISSTGFSLKLEPFVAQPRFVQVSVPGKEQGEARIILAKTAFAGSAVRFPKTVSDRFDVTFWYAQPLRLSEISFFDESVIRKNGSLRFLARPGESYSVLFGSDGPVDIPQAEPANLADDRDILRLPAVSPVSNPSFVPSDTDKDGIPDRSDNCTREANPSQQDENRNGRGDACDDYDKDGIINANDNCQAAPNRNQQDADGDGAGDACDDEESRILERNAWLLWVVIAVGGAVVAGLFASTMLQNRKK